MSRLMSAARGVADLMSSAQPMNLKFLHTKQIQSS
jgi:hypothetical protein